MEDEGPKKLSVKEIEKIMQRRVVLRPPKKSSTVAKGTHDDTTAMERRVKVGEFVRLKRMEEKARRDLEKEKKGKSQSLPIG